MSQIDNNVEKQRRLEAVSAQFAELARENQEFNRLLASSSVAIAKSLERFVTDTFGGPEQLKEIFAKIAQSLAPYIAGLPQAEERADRAERNVFEGLTRFSWFIDPEVPADIFLDIGDLVERQDEAEIDKVLTEYFGMAIVAIEEDAKKNNPERARLIGEGFSAHREKRYALSIPILFAQADGISRELLGEEYFSFGRVKDRPQALIEEIAGDLFLESALRALVPKGTIRLPTSEWAGGSLNRHAVMHGIDKNYDTERNSLKVVSLLNFMSRIKVMRNDAARLNRRAKVGLQA